MDCNAETWDLNRHRHESLTDYVKRVWKSEIFCETNCLGMNELKPSTIMEQNSKIKTHDHTFYFAHSTGERKRIKEKQRETWKEPSKLSRSVVGFDSGLSQDLKFRNNTKRLKRRDKKNQGTVIDHCKTVFKLIMNILSINQKLHFGDMHGTKWDFPHLDNRLNPNMNNVTSIDHVSRDLIDDTDYLLSRNTAEFPRISGVYTDKTKEKPWGQKSEPVYIDPFLDENQLQMNGDFGFEKGVWYYTGYPMTDHHDMAGLPGNFKHVQTMFGLEYRPTFWINIFNRLRYLDF